MLRIDRSFVIAMLDSSVEHDIVASAISLAHRLRLRVVAKGVDAEAQADALRALRCDEIQGFLYARPVAAGTLAELLARTHAHTVQAPRHRA